MIDFEKKTQKTLKIAIRIQATVKQLERSEDFVEVRVIVFPSGLQKDRKFKKRPTTLKPAQYITSIYRVA